MWYFGGWVLKMGLLALQMGEERMAFCTSSHKLKKRIENSF
ncbi:hypothetical protein GLYMA_08G317050v4 [Glycine max]|nr:hypothetical protein GLYMA_08G317050v4 [Glycine max]KAH1054083.1 hypothetical protein GYH30_023046 [Glycine max]